MTPRASVRLVGLVLLLAVAAPCAGRPAVEPVPHGPAQAQIERLVTAIAAANRGGPDAGIAEMAERLQQLVEDDRASLLQQLLLYLKTPRGNEQAMGGALLIESFEFTNDEKIVALLPCLDTDDDALRAITWGFLGTVDRPQGGPPDFAPYESVLSEGERAPAGLIRYLYSVSPLDALAATTAAFAGDEIGAELLQQARDLEQLRARQDPGPVAKSDRARRQLGLLSRSSAWWVRLYAAHVVRADPALGSTEIVDRLRSDPNDLVRETLAE